MFNVETKSIRYVYPWLKPFSERYRDLTRRRRKVAYFYHKVDNSTFRYRVYNMVEAINNSESDVSASWFTYNDLSVMDEVLSCIDKLIICRVPYCLSLKKLICDAQSKGIEVIFDCDDLVFDTNNLEYIFESLDLDLSVNGPWDSWFAYVGRVGASMKLCDRSFTSTQPLADELVKSSGRRVDVLQNFLNLDQMRVSEQIFFEKERSQFSRNGLIEIGYFSGSPTHTKDFKVAAGAIAEVMSRNKDVGLRLVGHINVDPILDHYRERIKYYSFRDYINLQIAIGSTEVNIAPLAFNKFTNCKSELKYFEAAIVGTLTVASDNDVFSAAIQNNKDGILSGEHEWETNIQKAIDAVKNKSMYTRYATQAYQVVLKKYGSPYQIQMIVNKIFS